MSTANMILHCGAREVTREQLEVVPCPPPDGRWRPVPHHTVLDFAVKALDEAGYGVDKMKLGLTRDDQRFWGTLVLKSAIVSGVSLACAIASSLDKSCSLRFGYGHSVFICDNGAWRVEETIARKHTTNGVTRYQEALCLAVSKIESFKQQEAERIRALTCRDLKDAEAESLLLRCYEAEILSPRTIHTALKEWRAPSFEEFQPRTAWSLFNSVTYAIGNRAKSNPQAHAALTIKLGALLSPESSAPQFCTPA